MPFYGASVGDDPLLVPAVVAVAVVPVVTAAVAVAVEALLHYYLLQVDLNLP